MAMLQGRNRAALVNANGEVELVNFRDATPDPDVPRRYTLSRLLRGRRCTESFTGGHVAGGLFIPISTATLERQNLPISDLDKSGEWKSVGLGARLGRHYPDQERRSRILGELVDGTGTVPLSEDSEAYELEILDAPGGNALRTVTGLSSRSYTYTTSQQSSDFGVFPEQLSFVVYRVSAQVGGFAGAATVEIEP